MRLILIMLVLMVPIAFGGYYISDTITEGEVRVYEGNITVELIAVSDSDNPVAKFVINGEALRSIGVKQSDKLDDGSELYVREIIPNEAGDPIFDIVSFSLMSYEECVESCGITAPVSTTVPATVTTSTTTVPVMTTTLPATTTSQVTTTTEAVVEEKGLFARFLDWISNIFKKS